MIRTKQQRRRDRKRPDGAVPPPFPNASVVSVVASASSQVTVTFDGPVMISNVNLPTTWLFGTANRTITALVSSTLLSYVFTLSGTAAATEAYTIDGNDPAARTTSGGYVDADTGTIAAP